jgi:hypothetical protein
MTETQRKAKNEARLAELSNAGRLDVGFVLDREKRTCVIGADKEAGRAVARIFTGFLIRQFGEDAFQVVREMP